MSQFRSDASLNDEILRGSTRFRFDGSKWKRIGQNFDTTAIAEEVAASIGGGGGDVSSVNGMTGDVTIEEPVGNFFEVIGTTINQYGPPTYHINGATMDPNNYLALNLLFGVGYKFDISDPNLSSGLFDVYYSDYPHYSRASVGATHATQEDVLFGSNGGVYQYGEKGTTGAYLRVEIPDRGEVYPPEYGAVYDRRYYLAYGHINTSPYTNQIYFKRADQDSIVADVDFPSFRTYNVLAQLTGSPYSGTWKYSVDGVEQDTLTLFRGMRYKFDLSSVNHSVVLTKNFSIWSTDISTPANSSDLYTNGFTKYGTEGVDGYAIFEVPHDAPNTLWYGGNNFYYYTNTQLKTMGATLEIQTITGS